MGNIKTIIKQIFIKIGDHAFASIVGAIVVTLLGAGAWKRDTIFSWFFSTTETFCLLYECQYFNEIFLGVLTLLFVIASISLYWQLRKTKKSLKAESQRLKLKLNDFICYNQGQLAQYAFLIAERHKKVKDELNRQNPDLDRLYEYYKELYFFHESKFHTIMQRNHAYIQKFLPSTKEGHLPRITLKSLEKTKIEDLFRHEEYAPRESERVCDNSGSEFIYRTGNYYLCNDIIDEIVNREYKNSRIDISRVKDLAKKKGTNFTQEEWMGCWYEQRIIPDDGTPWTLEKKPETCYRSTMIIPMTLINNKELESDFRKHFDIPIKSRKNKKVGKPTFGLLCFDSTSENYFNDDINPQIGYVFADIISLYLITAATYTRYSKTYREAKEKLESEGYKLPEGE